MDTGVIIAEVARRTGTLLDRNDPVLIVSTVADIVAEAHHAETRAGIAELRAVISSAQPRFDADNMRVLGRELQPGLFSIARNARLKLVAGVVVLLLLTHAAAFVAGWYMRGPAVNTFSIALPVDGERCEARDGGQLCWSPHWTTLPTAQGAASKK